MRTTKEQRWAIVNGIGDSDLKVFIADMAADCDAQSLERNNLWDRVARLKAILEKCLPLVEAERQMMDDINRFGVMPQGGEEEAAIVVRANEMDDLAKAIKTELIQ